MATDMGMINDFIQKEEQVKEQMFSGTKHHCIFEITHPNKHSECYLCKFVQDFGEDQEGADMMCESMNNFRKPDEEVWFIHRLLDQEEYDEIVRLRNEANKKWIETPTDDEYNRVVTKAKFQAYEKCMDMLQPVVIPHRQTEENRKFDGWDYLLKQNEELVRKNTRLKDYLQQVYFLMQNIKENDCVSLELMTKMDSWMDTVKKALNFDK